MSRSKLLAHWVVLCSLVVPAFAADWRPISQEELALTKSAKDPNADAEAFFKDVRVENNWVGAKRNVITTYIRIKIFNDRAREKYANPTIEYSGKETLFDVQGRTIHPDGSIVDLKRDAVFDKVLVKKGGIKVKVISFALPAVEPGSIIEYKWSKNFGEVIYRYIPLDVESDFPIDEVDFHIKSAERTFGDERMRYLPFGCQPVMGRSDSQGFSSLVVKNVPGYDDEPYSPPYYAARQWILVYYEQTDQTDKDKFWNSYGKSRYGSYVREKVKVNGDAKQTAAEIVAAGKTDEEKLDLIAAWCRKNIKNAFGDEITAEERENWKPNNSSADTLKRGQGTPEDRQLVFIALAQAAGYDARYALVADRRTFLFVPEVMSHYFVDNSDAAVSLNGKWKFYDVTSEAIPSGTLGWTEQGVQALLADPKQPEFVTTPLLTSEQTKSQHVGVFNLADDGTLEGDVRSLLYGNEAIDWRLRHAKSNDAEREELVRDQIKERFSDFEVSKIRVTASPDAKLPVGVAYHVIVRGYAQRTGKRIFLKPSFFAANKLSPFPQASRTNNIYFPYPWSEDDTIEIHLPKGYSLDHPDAPPNFNFAPVGHYIAKASIDNQNVLRFQRNFTFGTGEIPMFDAKNYPAIKAIFDQVHSSDDHVLTLKAAESAPAAK